MMRILNYLAVLAIACGLMGWSMKNGLETDVEILQEFRSRGIETTAQALYRETHTSSSRRGRQRHYYTYRIEHVLPSGQKVWSRVPAPDYSYDTSDYPFPIRIWYMPENPERVMAITDRPAVVDSERAETASTLMMIGGGGGVYWLIIGMVYWRKRQRAAPPPLPEPQALREEPEYYIAIDGQTTGPFTAAQVRAAGPEMPASALVWGPGFSEWLPLNQSLPA